MGCQKEPVIAASICRNDQIRQLRISLWKNEVRHVMLTLTAIEKEDIRSSIEPFRTQSSLFLRCLLYLTTDVRVGGKNSSPEVTGMRMASAMTFDSRQAALLLLYCSVFLYGLYFVLGVGRRKSGMPPGRYLRLYRLALSYTTRKVLLTSSKRPADAADHWQ